MNHLIKTN